MSPIEQIKNLLNLCSPAQREEIFRLLRQEFPIHPLEAHLRMPPAIRKPEAVLG